MKRPPSLLAQCGSIRVAAHSIRPQAAKAPIRARVLHIGAAFAHRSGEAPEDTNGRATDARARIAPRWPSTHAQPAPAAPGGHVWQLITRRRRLLTAVLVGVATAGLPSPVIASSGGGRRITDADARTVYLVVAALVLLAVGLRHVHLVVLAVDAR